MTTEARPAPKPLTPATFHILVTLADASAHGYHIKRLVEERTRGAVRLGAGTLYSGLRRMEKDGLIEEVEAPADEEAGAGARWRFYAITPRGSEALTDEIGRLESDLAAARAVAPRPA
jgi:DNA-binding PadR family transcriptional regulator